MIERSWFINMYSIIQRHCDFFVFFVIFAKKHVQNIIQKRSEFSEYFTKPQYSLLYKLTYLLKQLTISYCDLELEIIFSLSHPS